MHQVELLDTVEQWDLLARDWDTVVADSDDDNPFRRFAWAREWWRQFGADRSLRVITVRDSGELIAIAPLFLDLEAAPLAVRSIRFLGSTDVCPEYLGLLIKRGQEASTIPALLDVLFNEMNGEWDVIRWTDIPAGSEQLTCLQEVLSSRGVFHTQMAGTQNWVIDFPESWEDYLKSLSSSRRTKLRRIQREFDERDEAEIEFAADDAQFERCWDDLRILHNLHWAAEGQSGSFADSRFDQFHTELAREYLNRGELVLGSLRLNGDAIASCYGIRQGDTVYEYQRGHDPAYIRLRPGHALQFAAFERVIVAGVTNWDYLRGDYQHKRDWANRQRECVDVTIPAPRNTQLARFYLERAYRTTRRRLGVLRRRINSWLHTSPG